MDNVTNSSSHEIRVQVDKSHLLTLGERLYTQAIELIRELVNNAYDADATDVWVEISRDRIVVKDNGSGMDREGLESYFTIGSTEKLQDSLSPRFKRQRIGLFGIGKFASLAAAGRFEVFTQKGRYAARVVFDKEVWNSGENHWFLPLEELSPDPGRGNGTTVTLTKLTRFFAPDEVERVIAEGTPLRAPNFRVHLNGHPVLAKSHVGTRIPILEGSEYGAVTGEIVIEPKSKASVEDLGLEIKVKQVTICRKTFGMEQWGAVVGRIRGEVHADFLPVTSDRTGFVEDSPEYLAFLEVMERVKIHLGRVVGRIESRKEQRKASRALKEAVDRVQKALARNPELSPFGPIPEADPDAPGMGGAALKGKESRGPKVIPEKDGSKLSRKVEKAKERKRKPRLRQLSSNAVVKRVKFADTGVSFCIDSFGESGPESFAEGLIIYINQDHPLYRRELGKPATFVMHIARLLTQELSLLRDPRSPRQAYDCQSKLLKDAFYDAPSHRKSS